MINSKTVALLFALVSLGGMIAIPGLSLAPPPAFAQTIPDAGSIVDGVLDDVFGEEEDADNTQEINQPLDQDIDQDVDQSEDNDQDNTNTQTQAGAIDQDTIQGIEDGDDDEAESESESGDAEGKYSSSSSSSSGDASNENEQEAENNADLTQDQSQTVDQDNTATFGDDTTDLDGVNVAVPIAVPISLQEEEVIEEPDDEVPPPPEEEDAFFCIVGLAREALCFESLAECEELQVGVPDCQRFETLPEFAVICTVEEGLPVCQV
jgi:hypothetical protein